MMTYKMQSCYLTYSCYLYIVSDMLVYMGHHYLKKSIWVTNENIWIVHTNTQL
jgi:hypothetical protein